MVKNPKTAENLPEISDEIVNSAEALDKLIEKVKRAQKEYATFSQEQVNAIFKGSVDFFRLKHKRENV